MSMDKAPKLERTAAETIKEKVKMAPRVVLQAFYVEVGQGGEKRKEAESRMKSIFGDTSGWTTEELAELARQVNIERHS